MDNGPVDRLRRGIGNFLANPGHELGRIGTHLAGSALGGFGGPVGAIAGGKAADALFGRLFDPHDSVGPMPNENNGSFYPNRPAGFDGGSNDPFATPSTPYNFDFTRGQDFMPGLSPYSGNNDPAPMADPASVQPQINDWWNQPQSQGSPGSSGGYQGAAQQMGMGLGTYGGLAPSTQAFASNVEGFRPSAIPGIDARFGGNTIDLTRYLK